MTTLDDNADLIAEAMRRVRDTDPDPKRREAAVAVIGYCDDNGLLSEVTEPQPRPFSIVIDVGSFREHYDYLLEPVSLVTDNDEDAEALRCATDDQIDEALEHSFNQGDCWWWDQTDIAYGEALRHLVSTAEEVTT